MSLYVNETWTRKVADGHWIAEALALSKNSNDVAISAIGDTAEDANRRLRGGLRELGLLPKDCDESSPDADHEETGSVR